jgi:uncharacterized protein YjbI with pentapeptide repeats
MQSETGSPSTAKREGSPRSRKPLRWVVFGTPLTLVLGVVGIIVYGYIERPGWVGVANKEFWNYLELLIVPAALALGVFWLNRTQEDRERKAEEDRSEREREAEEAQRERELEVESQRAQDEALQAYLDQISRLLIDKERPLRRAPPGDDLSAVARARTLTVLTRLDGTRKRSVLQFLYESGLVIKDHVVVNLKGADLSDARLSAAELSGVNLSEAGLSGAYLNAADMRKIDLNEADLSEADLNAANLHEANLSGADLLKADLSAANLHKANLSEAELLEAYLNSANLHRATLSRADLRRAHLVRANLHEANLSRADLRRADLREANLHEADLAGADLGEADLRAADLRGVKLGKADLSDANLEGTLGIANDELQQQAYTLEGTTMPDGQKYEDWLKTYEGGHGKDGENSDLS